MGFQSLRFYHFRNLEDGFIDISKRETFLVGENGQGKTNILEALYCLSYGKSFRGMKDENLIRHGQPEALIEGNYHFDTSIPYLIQVQFRKDQKKISIDGKELTDRSELLGMVPSILFVPEDTQFIVGSPEKQRTFFNQTSILIFPTFLTLWKRYARLLKQRNAALKEKNTDLLDVYDIEFSHIGIQITEIRRTILQAFNTVFSSVYERVSQVSIAVSIQYLPSWETMDPTETLQLLKRKRGLDLSLGSSSCGPHRDRFRFTFGEGTFHTAASNGQIRLASLALKVAQALYFIEKTGQKPILLIDDVLLEMDHQRRKRFFSALPPFEQAIFTFLPDEPVDTYRTATTQVYTVLKGSWKAVGNEG